MYYYGSYNIGSDEDVDFFFSTFKYVLIIFIKKWKGRVRFINNLKYLNF